MSNDCREALAFIASELEDMSGRYHPGRPAYYALTQAAGAVRRAAREVDAAGAALPPMRVLAVLGVVGDSGKVSFIAAAPEGS